MDSKEGWKESTSLERQRAGNVSSNFHHLTITAQHGFKMWVEQSDK